MISAFFNLSDNFLFLFLQYFLVEMTAEIFAAQFRCRHEIGFEGKFSLISKKAEQPFSEFRIEYEEGPGQAAGEKILLSDSFCLHRWVHAAAVFDFYKGVGGAVSFVRGKLRAIAHKFKVSEISGHDFVNAVKLIAVGVERIQAQGLDCPSLLMDDVSAQQI